MWADFDRTAYTRDAWTAHVKSLTWTAFSPTTPKPLGITLHNTYQPTLAEWAESGPAHDQRILGLQKYYEGMGWHAGPHGFISRHFITGFTPLTEWGIHSTCFNHTHIGLEMAGDYSTEPFDSGDGALVRDNAVFAIATLMLKLGLTPEHNLVFHKDCPADHHDCPGKLVSKPDIIARVRAEMTALAAPAPIVHAPVPPAPAPVPPKPPVAPTASPVGYKFGKKPARAGAVSLQFAKYFSLAVLPVPPPEFGYESNLPVDSGVLGNDAYGDCVFAGADHETMLWASLGGSEHVSFSADTALEDYADATGFNPADPSTDQGTDMQAAASYRRKTGIVDGAGARHKVGAYVALEPGNLDQHKVAAWMFGAVGLGLSVSDTQIGQFDRGEPWDGALGSNRGGHYVPIVGYRGGYLLVVTWGRIQRVSPEFFAANNDESLVYLSEEMLRSGEGPTGLPLADLQGDLAAITSQPKGILSMSTVTSAALTAAEEAAGKIAAKAKLDELVPPWKQHLVGNEDDLLTQLTNAVVGSVDVVRNSQQ